MTIGERVIAIIRDVSIILAIWVMGVVGALVLKGIHDAANAPTGKPLYCSADPRSEVSKWPECQ